jgi:hypothetical protein
MDWGKRVTTYFVREFDDEVLDGQRVIRPQLLMHVLADHPILILLNQQQVRPPDPRSKSAYMRAWPDYPPCPRAHPRCIRTRADDEGDDGRKHCAAVGQLKDEARGVVVVWLDRFEAPRKRSGSSADFSCFCFGLEVVKVALENIAVNPPRKMYALRSVIPAPPR